MNRRTVALIASSVLAGGPLAGAADIAPSSAEFAAAQAELVKAIESDPKLEFNPVSILVKYNAEATLEAKTLALSAVGGTPVLEWSILPGTQLVRVAMEPSHAVDLLNSGFVPGIEYAELDWIVRTSTTPNDPSFPVLWGMHNTGQTVNGDPGIAGADINAPEAWDIYTGDANFVIADIDTGVNYNHADLAANSWLNPGEIAGNGVDDDGNGYIDDVRGWDFYSNDSNPIDDNGHGSHTAGTFGGVGNNGVGVAGVNWRCKIMALKFLSAGGSGSTSGAISAVNYAVAKGVKVSNNSWGGGGYSQSLFNAINASRSIGHIFVAAAGNNNTNTDSSTYYPQGYNLDNIISVAASDNNDGRASFSNYGRNTVDLAAPGVNIYSCYGSTYRYLNGTSMATPHVTGVVALLQAHNPSWTYSQVRQRIFDTVRPVAAFSTITVTGGVLDAFAAINTGVPSNQAPVVTITSPANGANFGSGVTIDVSGSASDAEDGDVTAGLTWTSSVDGPIGSGGSFSVVLSDGPHVISASVTDSGGRTGTAFVNISVTPANDDCAAAITLSDGIAVSGSTAGATNDGSASCGASSASADVWFTYTPTGTSTVTIDTCGSGFDTVLAVYTGSCGSLSQLDCNDDNGGLGSCPGGLTSYVAFTPTPNTTYRIRVAGYNGAVGSYTVRAAGGADTQPTAPAAPSNLSASRISGGALLEWVDNSNNETRFRIEREQRVGNRWEYSTDWTVDPDTTSDSDFPGNGTWRWRIRAENGTLASSWTSWVQQKLR